MKLKSIGLFLFLSIFLIFGYFINKNISIILSTFDTTINHLTAYIFLALLLSLISYYLIGFAFKLIFKIVGINRNMLQAMRLSLSAAAINIIIPSTGFASIAVFAEDADENNDSKAAEVSGGILYIISDYTAVSLILLAASLYLFSIGSLHWASLIPTVIFWAITLLLYGLLWLSTRKHDYLTKKATAFLMWVAHLIERFSKKRFKTKDFAEKFIDEFTSASLTISKNGKKWLNIIGVVLFGHLLKIITLYLIFLSFGAETLWRNVLVGYAIGATIAVISPTPSGIGFVEGAMGLAFINLGLSGNIAATTVLIYRAIVFWIPFFVGFVLLQGKRFRKIRDEIREIET